MPAVADQVAAQLGEPPLVSWDEIGAASSLSAGTRLQTPRPIFPRLDLKREAQAVHDDAGSGPKEPEAPKKPAEPDKPRPSDSAGRSNDAKPVEIDIEEFAKIQLRVGRVFEAEPLEGSDRLMKLQVIIGEDRRQIVAGIRKNYGPEDLIGRQLIVCTNLKPAKLRGVESQGMLLAAIDGDGGAILLQPDREAPEGARIK
jgi:methionyl-tRNA synthetase